MTVSPMANHLAITDINPVLDKHGRVKRLGPPAADDDLHPVDLQPVSPSTSLLKQLLQGEKGAVE